MDRRVKLDRDGLEDQGYRRVHEPKLDFTGWRLDAMTLLAITIFMAFAMGLSGYWDA